MESLDFNLYKGNYKRLMIIPAILMVVFIILIAAYPGIREGIDLKGGSQLLIQSSKSLDQKEVQTFVTQNFDLVDVRVATISSPLGNSVRVEYASSTNLSNAQNLVSSAQALLATDPTTARASALQALQLLGVSSKGTTASEIVAESLDALNSSQASQNDAIAKAIIQHFGLDSSTAYSSTTISPVLGQLFSSGGPWIALVSFLLVLMVIFAFFRQIIPTLAIMFAAIFDVLTAAAAMTLFGIPLSLITIPALLLIIGYSLDTDILLTTRVLKRKEGTARERAFDSMKTGLTMSSTTLAAAAVMIPLSYFTQLDVMFDIAFLLFFGLIGDMISTWLMNAPMLLWWVERKEVKP
ncbi:MAG: hypothetical protein V1847_01715 [Candidatus Diapherotrites archaeon]